jgi:hypothetical protein
MAEAHWLAGCWAGFASVLLLAELAALLGALDAAQGINL